LELTRNEIKNYYIHNQSNIDISVEDAIKWFRIPMFNDINNYKIPPVNRSKENLIKLKSK